MTIRPRFSGTVLEIIPIIRIILSHKCFVIFGPLFHIFLHGQIFDLVSDFSEDELTTVIDMEQLTRKVIARYKRKIL
jgi:hypothetical protein